MQAVHATSDGGWVADRLGDARTEEGAYVWQKLMKSGAVVTNGTDAPVESVDPIPNYYAAVTRKLANGRAFYPDQRMSRMEALRAYTIQNAFAGIDYAGAAGTRAESMNQPRKFFKGREFQNLHAAGGAECPRCVNFEGWGGTRSRSAGQTAYTGRFGCGRHPLSIIGRI
jgi:hypothetical protein